MGRRYVGVGGKTKYLAIYSVKTMDAMVKVVAEDPALKDSRAIEERRLFDTIPGKTDVVQNVYEQISGTHSVPVTVGNVAMSLAFS